MLGLVVPAVPVSASTGDPVLINELLVSHTGTDTTEYIELHGTPSLNLGGLSLIGVESDTGLSKGTIDFRVDFTSSDVLGANGFFLVGNPAGLGANYSVIPNLTIGQDALENSSATYALLHTSSLTGTVVTGSEPVLDAVAITDSATDTFFFGAPIVGPDGTFLPAGARRVTDGVDTDIAADWVLADFNLGPANTPTAGGEPPPPPICNTAPTVTQISIIQGSGAATPCNNQVVVIEGVVVGDYEGPSPTLRGFYVQEEDSDQDADATTSEGIFIFNGNNNSVALGDRVRAQGTAQEFQGQTQLGSPTVTVLAHLLIVTASEVTLPVPAADHLERFEGMLVRLPQTLTVTEHFQLGRFGMIVVSSGGRLSQPTQVAEPGPAALALQTANNLNRLIVDDELQNQNPDPIKFGRGGNPLSAANTLRAGDTVTGAVGVLTFTWAGNAASGNAYRLRPIGDLSDSGLVPGGTVPVFDATNPRPAAAPIVGGSIKVAASNVLNYFLTLDNNQLLCGPVGFKQECRGAETSIEFQRQRDKILAAVVELDADVLGLVELENTPGVEPMADLVTGLNTILGAGTYSYIDTGTIGTDAIKVGFLYQPGSVTPLGDHAIIDSSVDPRFISNLNRPSLAQSFIELASGEVFTAVVNHLKSKGSDCNAVGDPDIGDGQGNCNGVRTAAAQALVDWLASDPTGSGDDDVLVLGDLNSYGREDPIDVFVDAGYTNLGPTFEGPGGYSFGFDGQWGSLDHALASPSIFPQVMGADTYHNNSDEPSVLDYNTNFKSAAQVVSLYAPDEFRAADHDPLQIGLSLEMNPTASANPGQLFPPNHKLVRVDVTGSVGGAAATVSILTVTSSEADSGLDPEDVPNDIQIVDADTVDLRAERFAKSGRTYTITVFITTGAQSAIHQTTVFVPHSPPR